MTADASKLSIAQLEELLINRKTALMELQERREQLQSELTDVEAQIAAAEGSAGPIVVRGRRASKFTKLKDRKARKAVQRAKNEKSLRATVRELLENNKKGYSLSDLEQAVRDSGYKTNSVKFSNTLYQCLYNNKEFQLDKKSGTYKLQPPSGE